MEVFKKIEDYIAFPGLYFNNVLCRTCFIPHDAIQ